LKEESANELNPVDGAEERVLQSVLSVNGMEPFSKEGPVEAGKLVGYKGDVEANSGYRPLIEPGP
jgi:hypothetical protein